MDEFSTEGSSRTSSSSLSRKPRTPQAQDGVTPPPEAQASDYVMLDAMKIGGVTGWMRAAALAAARGVRVSSHLWPEISAQLLSVTSNAHWLEYADWWNPVIQNPLVIEKGFARPGGPIEWSK